MWIAFALPRSVNAEDVRSRGRAVEAGPKGPPGPVKWCRVRVVVFRGVQIRGGNPRVILG